MKPRNPNHKPWTQHDDDFMRDNYKRMKRAEIAEKLGRSIPSISNRAVILGLRVSKPARWTPEEEEFLRKNWRSMTITKIAKKLGRTWDAVEVKAGPGRLNLGPQVDPRKWTGQEIGSLLDIDRHVVLRWIEKGLLKARLAPLEGRKIYQVTTRELLRFLKENPDRWDARRCPNLVYDIEEKQDKAVFEEREISLEERKIPEELKENFNKFIAEVAVSIAVSQKSLERDNWFEKKLAQDRKLAERRFRKWTPEEDMRLAMLFKRGKTYGEIGAIMGRSAEAVGNRLKRINVWEILEREVIAI